MVKSSPTPRLAPVYDTHMAFEPCSSLRFERMEDRINAGSLIGDSVSALMVPSMSPPGGTPGTPGASGLQPGEIGESQFASGDLWIGTDAERATRGEPMALTFWVEATDSFGQRETAEFTLEVDSADAQGGVTVSGQPYEGETRTFTITPTALGARGGSEISEDWRAGDSVNPLEDVVSVFADWEGTGEFDELSNEDASWRLTAEGNIEFSHFYDDNTQTGDRLFYYAKFRFDTESGDSHEIGPINVRVENRPPLGELDPGTQIAHAATSGRDLWLLKPDNGIRFKAFSDVSAADGEDLKLDLCRLSEC